MLADQRLSIDAFLVDGFCLFERVVSDSDIWQLTEAIETLRAQLVSACAPGMRNLLRNCEQVRSFANSDSLRSIVSSILGSDAQPVRAILFDKTPASDWYVTWHQDFMIAVTQRIGVEGFGPWSVKDGIVHVQPPLAVLEKMVSLRVHLDDCPAENGAIKFIPGSHLNGVLEPEKIAQATAAGKASTCAANRGDIIAMRPLIVHSSSRADSPDRRRVLHIEYSSAHLPGGLEWARA